MLKADVPRGAIFHAASKRRRDVEFTPELRDGTIEAARRLHELVRQGRVPAAVLMPKCEGCSLKDICMPELSERGGVVRSASRNLFDHE
jgi:CRISPR-associated exonuclease Cas4